MAEEKDFEKLHRQTEERIVKLYREAISLDDSMPARDKIPFRSIMEDIAAQVGYTFMGVRKLLIRKGEYKPLASTGKRRRKVSTKKKGKKKCH